MHFFICINHLKVIFVFLCHYFHRSCDSSRNQSPSVQTMRALLNVIVKNVWELLLITIITRLEANKWRIPTIIPLRIKTWVLLSHYRSPINSSYSSGPLTPKSTCIWKCRNDNHPRASLSVYIRHRSSSPVSAPLAWKKEEQNWRQNCCHWTHSYRSKWCRSRSQTPPFCVIYCNFVTYIQKLITGNRI